MGDDRELERRIGQLGKGMVQVNLRLSRILELMEQGGSAPSRSGGDPGLDLLLELLDSVEHTLAAPVPAPSGWRRFLGAPPAPDLTGLALARDHALARLEHHGLVRSPVDGPADPLLHRVVETRPTDQPDLDGHILHTHRHGWHRAGDSVQVVRTADVTAWRHQRG